MKQDKLRLWERLSALLLAILVFAAGYMGGKTLVAYPYWQANDWQDMEKFERLTHRKLDTVMSLINNYLDLRDEENELTYMERRQLEGAVRRQRNEMAEDNTPFRFQVRSADGETVYFRNFGVGNLEEVVKNVRYTAFVGGEHVAGEGTERVDYEVYDSWPGPPTGSEAAVYDDAQGDEGGREKFVIEYGVPDLENIDYGQMEDEFYTLRSQYDVYRSQYKIDIQATLLLAAASAAAILLLLAAAGGRAVKAGYVPVWLDRVWLEFAVLFDLALGGLAGWGLWYLGTTYYIYRSTTGQGLVPCAVGALVLLLAGAAALMLRTFVVRACSRTLVNTTLFYKAVLLLRKVAASLPVLWRILAMFLVLLLSDLMMISMWSHLSVRTIWGAVRLVLLGYLCWWGISMNRLRKGTRTIASGNLNHQIDTAKMPSDLGELGENLNNISRGLTEAVDEKMKSERFKAELITNVSHDLKTPLTSIINYVNLLKTTEQTDPKALEYIKVLDRKSQRLKKLTEDLVEASKASTGVLSVHREKIGASQLLSQALAEWEDKLKDRTLSVVTTMPEGETWIYADGRHLWRVVDNLLSNCCKYAMEGTRVYVDMTRGKGQVSLQVKNVSREPLNIPAERLMERFVRGEASRSSEGSGLGLSIARSLTELQGGIFQLEVDGDLFKAIVTLPQAN